MTIEKALIFAEEKHRNQRYGKYPYMKHILHVLEIAQELNFKKSIQIACILHDTLEDTDTTYEELKELFGKEVADTVYSVTNIETEKGIDKKKTFKKIQPRYNAVAVKLADRLANIKASISFSKDEKKYNDYLLESIIFERYIYSNVIKKSPKLNNAWNLYNEILKIKIT